MGKIGGLKWKKNIKPEKKRINCVALIKMFVQ